MCLLNLMGALECDCLSRRSPTVLRPFATTTDERGDAPRARRETCRRFHKADETEQKMVDGEIRRGALDRQTHQAFLSHHPVVSELSAILPACSMGTAPRAMAFQIAI